MTAVGTSASRPRWSPDGKYLSFLGSRGEGKTQVWTLFRHGGDAVQITEVRQGVSSYDWSPDGGRLVLSIKDPKPEDVESDEAESEEDESEENAKKAKKPDTPPPWVVTRRQFKQDYVGYLDSRRTHLFVFDVASKELRQLTAGDYDDAQPTWSGDGTRLAFTSNRSEDPDARLEPRRQEHRAPFDHRRRRDRLRHLPPGGKPRFRR